MLRRAVVVAVASGSLLAAACSSSKAGVTAARKDIATAVANTTTTNPYAVPPVIDIAYVNRVLAGLDAAVGDVVRFVVKTKPAPHEITLQLKPLYTDHMASLQLEGFHQDSIEDFEGYRATPGNKISKVVELVSATSTCIFAHLSRDYGPVVDVPNPDLSDQWVALVPKELARDPNSYNVTGWMYAYDGFEIDHLRPKNPCGDSS